MNKSETTAQILQIKSATELHEMRCKRCHKLLLRYEAQYVNRQIEIICTKCKYKNIVLI